MTFPIQISGGRSLFVYSNGADFAASIRGPDGAVIADGIVIDVSDPDPLGGGLQRAFMGVSELANGDLRFFVHERETGGDREVRVTFQDVAPNGSKRGAPADTGNAFFEPDTTVDEWLSLPNGNIVYGETFLWMADRDFAIVPLDGALSSYRAGSSTTVFVNANALALTSSGFVWATMSDSQGAPVVLHFFDNAFNQIGNPMPVGPDQHQFALGGVSTNGVDVVELSDGRFAVAYATDRFTDSSKTGNAEAGIHLTIMNADGTTSVSEQKIVTPPTNSINQLPELFALDDGGFVLAFDQFSPQTTVIQVFDATGALQSEQVLDRSFGGDNAGLSSQNLVVEGDGDAYFVSAFGGSTLPDLIPAPGPTQGPDRLNGTDGPDVINGLGGADVINGKRGADDLDGGAGRDILRGGKGDDDLSGGRARDVLFGDRGDDSLAGGIGNDRLTGGRGDDVFIFRDNGGRDVVTDFNANRGREDIDLSGVSEIKNFRDLRKRHMEQDEDDVVIDDGAGTVIVLRNVVLADLDFGDFLF